MTRHVALCLGSTRGQPMAWIELMQCRLIYVATANEVDLWSCRLLDPAIEVVGWDIEWRVTFKSGKRQSAHCFLLPWALFCPVYRVAAYVQSRSLCVLQGRSDPCWLDVVEWQPPRGSKLCQTSTDPGGLADKSIANNCSVRNHVCWTT